MKINKLNLVNFRNYEEVEVEFQKGVNIIIGDNGVGKTNLVEAIDYLTLGKSFKTNDEKELIRFNQEFAKIELEFDRKEKTTLKAVISKEGKKISYNDIELKKLSELSGKLIDVLFIPEDVGFFKGSPSERRRFLDINLSSLDTSYLLALSTYKKLLKERNAILKEENVDKTYVEIIDEKMVGIQYQIVTHRKKIISKLNSMINEKYQNLDNSSNKVKLVYLTEVERTNSKEEYVKEMKKRYQDEFESDVKRKATSIGIHRDNLLMFLNGREIGVYGSQGQNRLGTLSLKLAMFEILKEELKEEPIVILDDVLSELDNEHQEKLIEELLKIEQVFITCAKEEFKFKNCSTFVVTKNSVIRRN